MRALILPEYINFAVRADGNISALDITGTTARPEDFTCQAWVGGRSVHLVIEPNASFNLVGAADPHPVACCR